MKNIFVILGIFAMATMVSTSNGRTDILQSIWNRVDSAVRHNEENPCENCMGLIKAIEAMHIIRTACTQCVVDLWDVDKQALNEVCYKTLEAYRFMSQVWLTVPRDIQNELAHTAFVSEAQKVKDQTERVIACIKNVPTDIDGHSINVERCEKEIRALRTISDTMFTDEKGAFKRSDPDGVDYIVGSQSTIHIHDGNIARDSYLVAYADVANATMLFAHAYYVCEHNVRRGVDMEGRCDEIKTIIHMMAELDRAMINPNPIQLSVANTIKTTRYTVLASQVHKMIGIFALLKNDMKEDVPEIPEIKAAINDTTQIIIETVVPFIKWTQEESIDESDTEKVEIAELAAIGIPVNAFIDCAYAIRDEKESTSQACMMIKIGTEYWNELRECGAGNALIGDIIEKKSKEAKAKVERDAEL